MLRTPVAAPAAAARSTQAQRACLPLRPTRTVAASASGRQLADSEEPSSRVASTSSSTTTSSSLAFQSSRYPLARRKEKPPTFIDKVKMAWRIFFPSQPKVETPKEEVKRRLKMVLVADRCGMTPASLEEMKKTIIKALQDYVDIEGEDGIEVAISNEPGIGTVYSVNIPVRRVKPQTRFSPDMVDTPEGITLEWDPHSDPASEFSDREAANRFPMGC